MSSLTRRFIPTLILWITALLGLSALFSISANAQVYNAAKGFSAVHNPNGLWSYGWSTSRGSAFNLYTFVGLYSHSDIWINGDHPSVFHNGTASDDDQGSWHLPLGKLAFHPGPNGENSIV